MQQWEKHLTGLRKGVFFHQITTEGHAQPNLVTIAFFSSDLGEARRDEGVEG